MFNVISFEKPSRPYPLPPVDRTPISVRSTAAGDNRPVAGFHWLAAALDELDYGIVLLFDGLHIGHMNDAARAELDACHPLRWVGNELRARSPHDAAPYQEAVSSAAQRGMRRLLTLGDADAERASISVIPLESAEPGARAVLIVLGKRSMCESLSVQGFARSHRLSAAETRVLIALCNGVAPTLVARQLGVAVSTVRSQIGSIRIKTGATSIRALVHQVAVLPPVKGVLGRMGEKRDAASLHPFACPPDDILQTSSRS